MNVALYVNDPFASAWFATVVPPNAVPPSICSVTEPVGVPEPLTAATVIVNTSAVFTLGEALDGTTVVVVMTRETPELTGQAPASAFRSTEPRPVTSSYPVPAEKPDVELQTLEPAVQLLLPLVMS